MDVSQQPRRDQLLARSLELMTLPSVQAAQAAAEQALLQPERWTDARRQLAEMFGSDHLAQDEGSPVRVLISMVMDRVLGRALRNISLSLELAELAGTASWDGALRWIEQTPLSDQPNLILLWREAGPAARTRARQRAAARLKKATGPGPVSRRPEDRTPLLSPDLGRTLELELRRWALEHSNRGRRHHRLERPFHPDAERRSPYEGLPRHAAALGRTVTGKPAEHQLDDAYGYSERLRLIERFTSLSRQSNRRTERARQHLGLPPRLGTANRSGSAQNAAQKRRSGTRRAAQRRASQRAQLLDNLRQRARCGPTTDPAQWRRDWILLVQELDQADWRLKSEAAWLNELCAVMQRLGVRCAWSETAPSETVDITAPQLRAIRQQCTDDLLLALTVNGRGP